MKKIYYSKPQTSVIHLATSEAVLLYVSEGPEGFGGGDAPKRHINTMYI